MALADVGHRREADGVRGAMGEGGRPDVRGRGLWDPVVQGRRLRTRSALAARWAERGADDAVVARAAVHEPDHVHRSEPRHDDAEHSDPGRGPEPGAGRGTRPAVPASVVCRGAGARGERTRVGGAAVGGAESRGRGAGVGGAWSRELSGADDPCGSCRRCGLGSRRWAGSGGTCGGQRGGVGGEFRVFSFRFEGRGDGAS